MTYRRYHLMPNGKKIYATQGGSIFSKKSAKKWFGKLKKNPLLKSLAKIGLSVAKELGPQIAVQVANKGLEKASKKGAPDSVVNLASKGVQKLAEKAPKHEEMEGFEGIARDVLSDQSQKLLAKILGGSGVRGFGSGVRGFGGSVRGFEGGRLQNVYDESM